tara:strand:+ start:396 stop:596 length:201 start_codon:yes stop_codon:yes gene_type:complete
MKQTFASKNQRWQTSKQTPRENRSKALFRRRVLEKQKKRKKQKEKNKERNLVQISRWLQYLRTQQN